VQRLLVLLAVPLAVSCGGSRNSSADVLARAQRSLRHLGDTPVALSVRVQSPVRIQRHFDAKASDLPLAKIELSRWTKHAERIRCAGGLECARGDVDVEAAVRALKPLLRGLPVNPHDVRSAQVDVAVEKSGRLRYLHVHGDLMAFLVEVPFEADLDIQPSP
jgi:hypothetical protein